MKLSLVCRESLVNYSFYGVRGRRQTSCELDCIMDLGRYANELIEYQLTSYHLRGIGRFSKSELQIGEFVFK